MIYDIYYVKFAAFNQEKRKDVLAEVGLKDAPENFGAASKVGDRREMVG